MKHTTEELKNLQSKSLEEKIQISIARIIEWYEYWNGKVYISNSGGVDSTVLSDLVHRVYPEVADVYCDTGLEYPELRQFIMNKPNVKILKPTKKDNKTIYTFPEIIKDKGYPLISKEVSLVVNQAKRGNPWGTAKINGKKINGEIDNYGKRMSKWNFLVDADFDIGNQCCMYMKKNPSKKFEHETGLHSFIGTMTEESNLRQTEWLKTGCNAFGSKRPVSTPISFWSKSDVLEYLLKFDVPYCKEIYGDIVYENEKYTTTKQKRTGCVFCGYGCHLEKEPNKFQILANTDHHLYDYCMRGGKYDESGIWVPDKGLGMAKVLDFINIKWWNDGDEDKRDEYRAKYKEKELRQKEKTVDKPIKE